MYQELFSNPLINNLDNIDWGRSIAPFNEQIIKAKYKDQDVEDVVSTCAGYDLLVNNQRIQCKLRQVSGKTPFSKSTYISTTRRHSQKNINKNVSGQICYSNTEFDFIFITLVHNNNRLIKDWKASLIPVKELDNGKGNLKTTISAELLKKYELPDFFK